MKRFLALLLALSMTFCLFGCSDRTETDNPTQETALNGESTTAPSAAGSETTEDSASTTPWEEEAEKNLIDLPEGDRTDYTVTVTTAGGMAMEGLHVYIYADDSKTQLADYGTTDASGLFTTSVPYESCYLALDNVPVGYEVDSLYTLSAGGNGISLTSAPLTSVSQNYFQTGDVMFNFTMKDNEGQTLNLSEILQEKKLLVLNFWFTTCTYCNAEFPVLEAAYSSYMDDVQIIALDPVESEDIVAEYRRSSGLSFPLLSTNTAWIQIFGLRGYPTTVFIDRYGMICLIQYGAITDNAAFAAAFEHFTADDYQQKLFDNINELM